MATEIKILNFHVQILKLLFLWPKSCLSKNQNILVNYGYFFLMMCNNVPVVWAVVYQLSVGIDNLDIFIEALIGVCDIIGYMVVYISLLTNQVTVEKIIRDIKVFLSYCDRKIIEEVDADCVRYTKYLLVYVTVGVMLNLAWPLISTKQCTISRGSDFYLKHDPCGMVTQHFYPFDASNPHIFWLLFIVEACYCYHICCEFSLATATVVGLLMHIIAQLKNCSKMFAEVFDRTLDETIFDTEVQKKFVNCVKYHQAILEYSERVCSIFSNMLIIYVTMTSCTLAVISYQIANSSTTMIDRIRYTMLLFGWVLLFFLICYYAQKLENESIKIADSAYNSKWYEVQTSTKTKKNVTLVIARAQKPISLKVKYMGTISLVRFVSVMCFLLVINVACRQAILDNFLEPECCISSLNLKIIEVLKTAYSFFTLLLTVTDDE